MTRILLITDTDMPIGALAPALQAAGMDVVGEANTARALVQRLASLSPEVVLADVESPLRDSLEAFAITRPYGPRMSSGGSLRATLATGIAVYATHDVPESVSQHAFLVARATLATTQPSQKGAPGEPPDRGLIEHAKNVLMHEQGMQENEAVSTLRRQARDQGIRLVDVARRVIAMSTPSP
ncbi:histidine kinase [Chitiniphilus shinanonensis]|uniref:Histidine kinase n=1 Tax=Chitiniphilus shinanonensis TaxID=553088 RepID=A0ABQ6BV76_9NEIS|nr:ANTAR domain-containing protein [Chitiniphilus shinanonensis]GLS04087.1 histidine kinase [Chitiniphilus shinanonensis]